MQEHQEINDPHQAQTDKLISQMTLDEKLDQMTGDSNLLRDGWAMFTAYNFKPIPAGENKPLGIMPLMFSDGPRGLVVNHSTCFPVSMARGASWDVDLEERIGDAIGVEGRSLGANFFGGVCINLLRHPAWGRAQETYGEDPYHLGEMGAALVRGVQRHMMACAKHYACNSIENARFKVNVKVSERILREIYLPHFKRCVEEGVASIMSAYNKVNGAYCGNNIHLINEILKKEWGFKGFVMSDFVWGVRDGKASITAGLDIEMPFAKHYSKNIKRMVESGDISEALIDDSVRRILQMKLRFAEVGNPDRYQPDQVVSAEHIALAREAAEKSIVLLKNEPSANSGVPLLPLDLANLSSIAIIGKLASAENTGDHGSSEVRPPYVITSLQGIQDAIVSSGVHVVYDSGKNLDSVAEIAKKSDIAIVFAGYTYEDEGEYIKYLWITKGGDRDSLCLNQHDEELIRTIAGVNPNVVVAMIGGSAIVTETWRELVPAILMTWYSGMEGGNAIADILLGRVNPSGKLPCIFPKSNQQLPFFDRDADEIDYEYYHGYRLLDKNKDQAAFPFGFGLSYTTFRYTNLRISNDSVDQDGSIHCSVDVQNTGNMAGDEVVQLYVGYEGSIVDRPLKELKGFTRVTIKPGEIRTVNFSVPVQNLAYYDEISAKWVVEPIVYHVLIGPSSAEGELLKTQFRIAEREV